MRYRADFRWTNKDLGRHAVQTDGHVQADNDQKGIGEIKGEANSNSSPSMDSSVGGEGGC